jgi:hypothetical protein
MSRKHFDTIYTTRLTPGPLCNYNDTFKWDKLW